MAEYDGAGQLLRRYIHGPGVDEPLIWYEGAGLATARYYHTNHQGSIIALADASGTLSAIKSYDAYGIPDAVNPTLGRFSYTGQIWLPELGVYHYKARAYSPTLGRFMQTDPIGYKDQVNLYAYVGNDSVNGRDPSGLLDDTAAARAATEAAKMAADAMARKAALETGLRILSTTAILAMPLMVSGDTQQPKNETLFRGITNRDAASIAKGNGINAKDPRANATMEQHILEPAKPSQFISTTKDFATASGFAGKGGTVVVIDGSKVPGKTDLSAGSFQIGVMANILAFRDSEVLVRNNIPQSALVGEVKIP